MDTLEKYFDKIAAFVLEQNELKPIGRQNVIKQHTEKLPVHGDFGFPISLQAWLHFAHNTNGFDTKQKIIERDGNGTFIKNLIGFSSKLDFPIERIKFQPFRCLLFLNREKCFDRVLKSVIFDDPLYGRWNDGIEKIYNIEAQHHGDNTLTEYRCNILSKVLSNLIHASGFQTIQSNGKKGNKDNLIDVFVSPGKREASANIEYNNNNNNNNNIFETRKIICGAVRSRRSQCINDFIDGRVELMAKMAEIKYGTNKNDHIPYDYSKLGTAVINFDLLKTKHINAIDFDIMCDQKSIIKGAAFILYNVARLQKLLSTFDEHVSSGFYDVPPPLEYIDFSLLKEEEEWQMFYVYVIGFPTMLERCVGGIDDGHVSIHLLCTFLNNLAASFSVYYHRVKILTENLPQLMPVLFARVYLLKSLRVIFLKALSILEIEPLDEM